MLMVSAQDTRQSKYAWGRVRSSPLGTMPQTQATSVSRANPRARPRNQPGSATTSSSVKATIWCRAAVSPRLRADDNPATGSTTRRNRGSSISSTTSAVAGPCGALSTTITSKSG